MSGDKKNVKSDEVSPRQRLLNGMDFLEQFAESVVDYTSKYSNINTISYAPENLTGKPAKYPQYGDFPDTYTLRSYGRWWNESEAAQPHYMPQDAEKINSEDYIVVRFETYVVPDKIKIYETYNPGAIVRLWGRKTGRQWILMHEEPPQICERSARKFEPVLREINDTINEIRIEFNQSHLAYHTSLDAVLLAGYKPKSPIQLGILSKGLLGPPPIPRVEKRRQTSCSVVEGSVDLFSMLPYELIVHIFQYLDLTSLCRCAQVNKRWHEATLDSAIYQAISLKKYWVKVDDHTLDFFKKRCRALKKLDFSWCGYDQRINENVFQSFLSKSGKQLTHLSLCNCNFVQNVTMLEISKCLELRDLRLRNIFPSQWTFCKFENLTKLVALDLYASAITNDSMIRILKANRNLKHLILDFCENLENLDQVTETISHYNQKIVTLSCWKTKSFSAQGVRHLSRCSNLRELDLGWCLILTDPENCLQRIAQGCPDLRRLILSNWRGLADHMLLPIIRSCKQLAQLDLLGIKNITSDICNCALASLPKLKLLDVSFCDSIGTSQVEAWKSIYPEVSIQKSTETVVEYWT